MHLRARITLWNREEDGSYQAELDGWHLHVTYTPEPPRGGPFGFSWSAEGPDAKKAASTELLEEPELAMCAAEAAAVAGGASTTPAS